MSADRDAKTPKWTLSVSVQMDDTRADRTWGAIESRLTELAGPYAEDVGAGTGFGARDRQWEFDTTLEAAKAGRRIKAEYKDACDVWIQREVEEDEG